jgi:fucose 4-O-acetylase-like acetyltransferase
MKNDNKQFSCLKGLAILGVVVGHIGFWTIEIFANYWHLPIFYFVSGYFFKQKHIDAPAKYIIGRIKRLLVPYYLVAIIAILLHNSMSQYGFIVEDEYAFTDLLIRIKDQLFNLSQYPEQIVGATWFLLSLFFVSMYAIGVTALLKFCRISIRYELVGVVVSSLGVIGILMRLPIPIIWLANMVLTGLFFAGYACAKSKKMERFISRPILAVISFVIMVICMMFHVSVGCQYGSIYDISLWHPFLFALGIILIFALNNKVYRTAIGRVIAYIGDYSFSIMVLHFVAFKLVTLIHKQIDPHISLSSFPTSTVDLMYWAPLYIILGVALPILCLHVYSYACNCVRYLWRYSF